MPEAIRYDSFPDPRQQTTIRVLATEADDSFKLSGRSGGQIAYGGTVSGEDLELHSNPSKNGLIKLGDDSAYDESNVYLGIGTQAPGAEVHVKVSDGASVLAESTAANSQANIGLKNDARTYAIQVDGTDGDKLKVLDATSSTAPIVIEAAAPSNSVYIDNSGRVGIRTNSPSQALDIVGSGAIAARIQSTGGSPSVAQFQLQDANRYWRWLVSSALADAMALQDVTGSLVPFRIEKGAPNDSLRVETGGIALFGSGSFGGGAGVVFVADRTTAPTSDPTGGGVLYAESGALKWRGSSGTVTTIAPA